MIINYLYLFIVIFLIVIIIFLTFFFLRRIKNIKKVSDENLKLIINTINSVRYGDLAARLIIDEKNRFPLLSESINRMVETIQDREKMIQEFKKELTGQNFFLETLINSLSEGFLILDENLLIKKMTSESEKIFGKTAEGNLLSQYIDLPEKCDLSVRTSFEADLKTDVNIKLFGIISQLNFADNSDFKYLLTVKDISKENELKQIKSDFIATLAHDLRVPLLAESKTLTLIKNGNFGEVTEKLNQVTDLLIQSNKDVLMLTDVLLETYKLEQAELIMHKQCVNINLLIKEVCDEMFGTLAASSMKINLNLCEDFDVYLDVFQIKRVLRNLINNSIDYSVQQSDRIDIYTNRFESSFSIIIRDYGNGISEEEKSHIFKKFYSGAHKFRKVGSGLGLYLANEIVKAHDGTIMIDSEPNSKTDFIINLPL